MTKEQELLTVREAARECGRNPETVRRWIWGGRLPAQKLGNQLFVKRSDLAGLTQKETDEAERAARKAARLAWLEAAIANAERIYQRTGTKFDVVKILERHRRSHP